MNLNGIMQQIYIMFNTQISSCTDLVPWSLPLMIGERVPANDEHWNNFFLLLTILDYIFAPVISPDCIAHLKDLIDEHHQCFRELYPTCSITPKMHYIVHYPECIERQVMKIVSFRNLHARQGHLWDVLRGGWESRFKKLRL